MKYIPHNYQKRAEEFLLENPHSLLFLEMGLGKTVTLLSAFEKLRFDRFETKSVLIVAPLRVVQLVWAQESKKWDHTRDFRVVKLHGPKKDENLTRPADIYLINYEGLGWLRKKLKTPGGRDFYKKIDMVVFDESTMVKNPRAVRSKTAFLISSGCKRRVALTGSPTPNKLLDLWNQVYLIDHGKRLGRSFYEFRNKYFISSGFGGYTWKPKRNSKEDILKKISDIALVMRTEDYLELPRRIDTTVEVQLPPKFRKAYDALEEEFFLEIGEEKITTVQGVGCAMKLRQFLQGFIYDTEKDTVEDLHDIKIKALAEVVEGADSPVLVAFQFRWELEKLRKEFGAIPALYGGTRNSEVEGIVKNWNDGKTPVLACHPASVAHGVNLQQGGNTIVWLGLSYNLEQDVQFNARLHRQGQTKPVYVYKIVVKDSMDEVMSGAVEEKDGYQRGLMNSLERYIAQKRWLKDV